MATARACTSRPRSSTSGPRWSRWPAWCSARSSGRCRPGRRSTRRPAEVIAADDQARALRDLDQKIFSLQLLEAPVAGDQRLHVGLIAVIALERVGDLAVAIADASTSVRPEGAVPEVEALISRMSARGVDTLARAVQAIARGDAELGEEAADEADTVRQMLGEVIAAVAAAPDEPETASGRRRPCSSRAIWSRSRTTAPARRPRALPGERALRPGPA